MRLRRLSLAALFVAASASAPAEAQQGIAFTAPREPVPGNERPMMPLVHRPVSNEAGSVVSAAGRLPNQATGPKKERFVRDICIGC